MDAVPTGRSVGHSLMSRFHQKRIHGSASDLHLRDPAAGVVPSVVRLDVAGPTIVLGSTQADEVLLPADDLAASDIEVARRRSGGGLVWLAPGVSHWIDVTIGDDDKHWTDDVGAAFVWLGDLFVDALLESGVAATAHRGRFVDKGAGSLLCFAGLGSGEVTVEGRKLVGMSQRRVRGRARFQIVMYETWQPAPLLGALSPDHVGEAVIERLVQDAHGFGIGCSELGIAADQLIERVFR